MRPAPRNQLAAVVDVIAVMYLYHHSLNDDRITYAIPRVAPDPAAHHH